MPGSLEGRVAIVTGGGWNIGRAIACRFAAEGAAVAICGRRAEPLAETAAEIESAGGRVLQRQADVTELAQMEELAAATLTAFGAIDVVAAIAGGGGGYEAVDVIDPSWWEHVIKINLLGTFHAVRAALPAMRAQGAGAIITTSGGGAYFPELGLEATAYASAKAGVCRFTDQLACELLDTGIRVNCLQPGLVWNAELLRKIEADERRTGQPHPQREANHSPQEAAELAVWLASDESRPLTGRLVAVDDDWWHDPEKVQAVCASLHAFGLRRMQL